MCSHQSDADDECAVCGCVRFGVFLVNAKIEN